MFVVFDFDMLAVIYFDLFLTCSFLWSNFAVLLAYFCGHFLGIDELNWSYILLCTGMNGYEENNFYTFFESSWEVHD